ncbi:hypothetical protein JCM10212_003095 [Sporobolomyces blumeae]
MNVTITDWSNSGARAFGCPPLLETALEAATQVKKNEGEGYSSIEYVAVWACRYSSNDIVAKTAHDLWPTLNSYGYYPSAGFAIAAMIIFGLSGALHLYQLGRSRRWAYVSVLCAGGLEVYGWYLRYGSSKDVMYGYVVQLAVLTIAPTFYAGGIYALFYAFAEQGDHSLLPLLRPRAFSWTIFGIEIVTLCVQAAGGALAATTQKTNIFDLGTHIMTAGTALQLATSVLFTVLFLVYFRRLGRTRANCFSLRTSVGLIFWGTLAMEFFIIVRGCYRTVELSEGLFGKLGTTQIALLLGDAVPMFFVTILLNIVHPLWTIGPKRQRQRHHSVARSDDSTVELKETPSSVQSAV